MSEALREFHEELFQEIHRDADADGRFAEDSFFEVITNYLVDAGELETADRAFYQSARGLRVDGYGGDPSLAEGTLTIIVCDFNQGSEVETLTSTDMNTTLKRPTAFLAKALDRSFRDTLEETSPGFGLAELIASTWSITSKVRVFLLTNRVLSSRIDSVPAGEVKGVPVNYNVWDLGRLHRFLHSGKGREEIQVDLAEYGQPLPALAAHLDKAGYKAFLLVVPGEQLASIYGRWGQRLLEQNVRVFLQARAGVNKGIKNTIDNDPEMFFAYNNGITATAEEVTCETRPGGLVVTSLKNLQIVNGGQTTASIYAASLRKAAGLDKLFVQMKLSVIPPALSEAVVPRISEYANTQNRVNAADFFANHPYHLRMKDLSQRLYAPSPDGTVRESKWFYERARGQYQDARADLTVAGKKKFDLEFPKRQLFSKTDLAKYLFSWDGKPDVVSKGAQKNFAEFAKEVGKDWDANPDVFNEHYYRATVAKAIIFRHSEALVSKQPWYEGGYRANIVTYAVAKLASDLRFRGLAPDLESVWKQQRLSPAFDAALAVAAQAVKDVIVDPPAGKARNVTEWAKQPACWNRVQNLKVDWPKAWLAELRGADQEREEKKQGVKDQRILNGIEAQAAVVNAGPMLWRSMKEWAVAHRVLTQMELEILEVAASIPKKIPSDKQALVVMSAVSKLRTEGCRLGADVLPI